MIPVKKNTWVVPIIVETIPTEEGEPRDSIHDPSPPRAARLSQNKKRTPSSAYMQSAKSNIRLSIEARKNSGEPLYPIIITNESITARIQRIGWKTVVVTLFLVVFSLGILIGTFASINTLPKQGFYLFLVIGLVVFVPACYSVYSLMGKFFLWKGFEPDPILPTTPKSAIV